MAAAMGTPRALSTGGVLALTLAALCAAPRLATAQSSKDKKAASDKVKQAIAKSQAGDHQTAIELYNDAYKIIPQPLLLSNIGSEYQQLGKPVEALTFFCKYIEAEPTGSNVGYARAQAKTLYIDLGGIKNVKDEDVCKPIVKEPEKPGDGANGVGNGRDGSAGNSGGSSGDQEPIDTGSSKPKVSPLRWVGVGAAVLGAGVFGLGIYYGAKAKSISDDITNHPMNEPWNGIVQLEADGKSYEKKQIAFMIGGGIALAAGVTLFFLAAPKKSAETTSTALSITPVATPDQLGFAASGRF
jgi:tetratricopeptide (TPR) repeat protein